MVKETEVFEDQHLCLWQSHKETVLSVRSLHLVVYQFSRVTLQLDYEDYYSLSCEKPLSLTNQRFFCNHSAAGQLLARAALTRHRYRYPWVSHMNTFYDTQGLQSFLARERTELIADCVGHLHKSFITHVWKAYCAYCSQ